MNHKILLCIISIIFSISVFSSCSSASNDTDVKTDVASNAPTATPEVIVPPTPTKASEATAIPTPTPEVTIPPIIIVLPTPTPEVTPALPKRDSTPYCPMPEASGIEVVGNELTQIDLSNTSDGYILAKYTGTNPKVIIIIYDPSSYNNTYNLNSNEYLSFPLIGGNGSYTVGIYENIEGNSYRTLLTTDFEVTLTDEFSPFLRPNRYVNYSSDSAAVQLASTLCKDASNDLECIKLIYDYIIHNITYDYDKRDATLENRLQGYLSDVDVTLETGTGICLDYAALMTCMLRSQGIPTRLVVGDAGEVYHAWINVYTSETGWVNRIAEFDGEHWVLMDPTFAASYSQTQLKKILENPSYYIVEHIY